tara:strand:+ start:422 stop:604 length:183 start_codon:yes stop_codon:yes gene_type:complete
MYKIQEKEKKSRKENLIQVFHLRIILSFFTLKEATIKVGCIIISRRYSYCPVKHLRKQNA